MRPALPTALAATALLAACELVPTAPLSGDADAAVDSAYFAPGDVLTIDVSLHGCFHERRIVATLRIDGDSAIVEDVRFEGDVAPGYLYRPIAALAPRQLTGLRSLLGEYRKPSTNICTFSEVGVVELRRSGAILARQQFEDSSCRWFGARELPFDWPMLADVVASSDGAG